MNKATQIEFRPAGRGFVNVAFTHSAHEAQIAYVLSYPTQGQMMGGPEIDVKNANILQEAAQALNDALLSLSHRRKEPPLGT